MSAPTSFGLAFFLRVAVPGLLLVLLAAPLLPKGLALDLSTAGLATIGALAGLAGIALYLLDTLIYDIFEGRAFWPAGFRDSKTSKWEAWLDVQWARITEKETARDRLEQVQPQNAAQLLILERDLGLLYDSVMDFPFTDDGRPHAIWPTRFGNVMASYEYYPETRYGMDSAFYWYRLWLLTPDDTRKEYDTYWSVGQVWLYGSAVSFLATVTYGILALWVIAEKLIATFAGRIPIGWVRQVASYLDDPRAPTRIVSSVGARLGEWDWRVLLAIVGLTALVYLLWKLTYRLAIVQHRSNGEFFKSLFDLYREELEVQRFDVNSAGDWSDAANFLQFFRGGSVLRRRRKNSAASS